MLWAESILAHNIIDIHHHRGVLNHAMDTLSRMWCDKDPHPRDCQDINVLPEWEPLTGMDTVLFITPLTTSLMEMDLLHCFNGNQYFTPIVHFLSNTPTTASVKEPHILFPGNGHIHHQIPTLSLCLPLVPCHPHF